MDTTTLNSMCRCCAAEGMFKDIKTSYHWMGEEEVYGDMLRECFDVKLVSVEDGGICEVCITQLRNASNFKKQVLHTEKKFKRILDSRQFKPTEVKEEVSGDENSSSEDNENDRDVDNDNIDDEDYVPDFEMPIKTESPEESKSRKRGAKATTSRAKKSRVADDEDKSRPNHEKVPPVNPNWRHPVMEMAPRRKKIYDMKQILLCSNATPMWTHTTSGYKCGYCEDKYPRLDRLKKHTLEEHDDVNEARFFITSWSFCFEIIVKMDITSLECKLCSEKIDTLNSLIQHLVTTHKKYINMDIAKQIIPFKFDSATDELCCGICPRTFASYKNVEQHMNEHMRNHECKDCKEGYLSRSMLDRHKREVHEYNPPKKQKQKSSNNMPVKCLECGETFLTYAMKKYHVLKVHRRDDYDCHACDKVFDMREKLRIHIKRDHLMEKKHRCSVCQKAFYERAHMLKHELKHTEEKRYSCSECGKTFKTKTSLTPHMNIHNGVRRFECDVCGLKFVQKASWKGHMRARHAVIV